MTGYNPSAAITSFGGAFPCRPMNPYGIQPVHIVGRFKGNYPVNPI